MTPDRRTRQSFLGPDLSDALEAVTSAVLLHAGGAILFANAAAQRLLGYPDAELRNMRFDAWADPEDRKAVYRYGLRCLEEEGELPAIEVSACTLSGARRALEVTGRRAVVNATAVTIFTCQDLSDIRYVQTSLIDMGRVLSQIIGGTPVATFVIDANHRVTHWNAACEQLTGVSADRVLGRDDAWSFFYAQAQPLLADLIVDGTVAVEAPRLYGSRCAPSHTVAGAYEVEGHFTNFSVGPRWLHFTAAPLVDAQGRISGAIETLLDVTRRHQVEEQLLQHRNELESQVVNRTADLLSTHRELEAFLENAPVGIIAASRGRITRGNRKFREIFELDGISPTGVAVQELFACRQDYAALRRQALRTLSQGESLVHEMPMRTLGGNSLWVQLIAYVANPAESSIGTWWLVQDWTEMRRVERELQINYERIKQSNTRLEEAQNQLLQSEKMASIGQLAAGVAHEINNPIGFVSSNLSVLRKYVEPVFEMLTTLRGAAPEDFAAVAQCEIARVERAVDLDFALEDLPQLLDESDEGLGRVKKIVQDLKDFSRVDHADWLEADLNAGLDSTLNVVMNEVKYKARIEKDYQALPPVRCIAAQLNQVFMNLIVNAAQAIAERGRITLRTRHDDGWVHVEVEDTGCGMSEEVRRRVFEPFYTTKPVGQGTGLGLSLSFSIVQKHGGRIDIDSTPGVGTTFKVSVPVAGPAATAVPAAA
ncbi:MAG: PAS domain S-box protein [Pelomonas sp.]|nr:PAS domain S-box protein [Roseateles sp.]